MNPRFLKRALAGATITGALLLASHAVSAEENGQVYEVTITNLTRGQIISPPVVLTHNAEFSLFQAGTPASAGLAAVAQDADTSILIPELELDGDVADVVEAGGVIVPGGSISVTVTASGDAKKLSAVGMLVTTNDAFFAVSGIDLPNHGGGAVTVRAVAYDAGSEANGEDCLYIPGPPCGNPFMADPGTPEGFVHVHAGIHGVADLVPYRDDWRNPVALVTIARVSGGE